MPGPAARIGGSKEVAKIAAEGAIPEDTARLFKPKDNGDMSTSAIKTIERLKKVGATSEDLDQVRGIVLDTLLTGDPGKVATRVDNFIKNNPTAANSLFSSDQLDRLKNWRKTNEALVTKKEALNPPQSSYGPMREMIRAGTRGATMNAALIGSILAGVPGAIVGGVPLAPLASRLCRGWHPGICKAKSALAPADRSARRRNLSLPGPGDRPRIATSGTLQAGQTMTVMTPAASTTARQGKVVEIGENMVRLRMPDGRIKQVGKKLLRPVRGASSLISRQEALCAKRPLG